MVVIVLELLLLWWMFFFYTQSASMVVNSSMNNDPFFFFFTPSQPVWLKISAWTATLGFVHPANQDGYGYQCEQWYLFCVFHTQSASMIINISVHPDTFFFYIHSTRMVISAWTVILVCFLHPFNQDGHKCQHFLWFGEPCSHCEHGAFCSKDNLNSKRVMLFTNNDDPHAGNANLQVLFHDVSVFLHFCLILALFPFFVSFFGCSFFLAFPFPLFFSLSVCLILSVCVCV